VSARTFRCVLVLFLATLLLAASTQADLWNSGFRMSDIPGEDPPSLPAPRSAVSDSTKHDDSMKVVGWFMIVSGAAISAVGLNRKEETCTYVGWGLESCQEEYRPNWLLVAAGSLLVGFGWGLVKAKK
jgi:hypothetical protein